MSKNSTINISDWKVISRDCGNHEIMAGFIHPEGGKAVAHFNLAGECTFHVDWSGYRPGNLPAEVIQAAAEQIEVASRPKSEAIQRLRKLQERRPGVDRRPRPVSDDYFMQAL